MEHKKIILEKSTVYPNTPKTRAAKYRNANLAPALSGIGACIGGAAGGAFVGAALGNPIIGGIVGCGLFVGPGIAAGNELPPSSPPESNPAPPPFADPFGEGEDALLQPQRIDPLILDLDGDGVIKTTTVTDGAFFDMDCNGFAELTAWAMEGEGVLARDVDNDGWITDGKEIFGDQTLLANGNIATDGFEALADLDSNGDNEINAADRTVDDNVVLDELGVIKDGEFFYLSELGITAISLNTTVVNKEENGNLLVKTSKLYKEWSYI